MSFSTDRSHLGHIITVQGAVTDKEKVSIIKKWSTPPPSLRSKAFWDSLGTQQFIPKFVQIAQPLHKLTSSKNAGKKRAAITWDNTCQQSFNELKHLCTTAPNLAYADFTRPFKLHTNACGSGLGKSSTRSMMTGLIPSSPILAGAWLRLKPTTQPTSGVSHP